MANRWGNNGNSDKLYFGGSKITADGDCSHEIQRWLLLGRKAMINLDSILKSRYITLPMKIHIIKAAVFPVVRVGLWKDWAPNNRCLWTVVLKNTLNSPLDCRIKPINHKGNQSWIFIARTEAPKLWPPDVKSQLIAKDPDAGKDWGWEEKGTTEDKMVGWHHWLNGHESEQTLRDSEGHGILSCCSLRGCKKSDRT